MSEKYEGIERLLGLPKGSTAKSEGELRPLLIKGVQHKTDSLKKDIDKMEVLDGMQSPDLVKNGFDLDELERDKVRLKREAFDVYDISRSLLERFKDQIDGSVNPNDRMWGSAAKMIDSVTGSIDKLSNMILKFKQEEEMKGLAILGENEETSKSMSPEDWMSFIKEVKNSDENDITDTVEVTEKPSTDSQS